MQKTLTWLLATVFMINISLSQTKEDQKEPSTKIGAFLAKKGRVLVKDFYSVGSLNGSYGTSIDFNVLVIYEPGKESDRILGLKIEVKESGRIEKSNSSFLDVDEVDALFTAVSYLATTSATWKASLKEYTELIFSTKDDFSLGFYQKGTDQSCFTSSGYIGKTTCFFDVEDLQKLTEIAQKAKNLISQK